MRRFLRGIAAFLCGVLLVAGDASAAWPEKPVKIIVPFSAGGITDILARLFAQKFSEAAGQQFIVENRAGAGGNIGADMAAKAAPDGYTLLLNNPGSFSINQFLYQNLPYSPEKDFAGIMTIAQFPNAVMVTKDLPVRSVRELIDYAKKNPEALSGCSAGIGTSGHLSLELFKSMTDTKITHVTYGGAANARIDLAAGRVQVAIDNVPSYLAEIQSGAVRMLAVGSTKRLESFPDVPTAEEAGLPGYEANVWYAFAVRKGTPREIIDKVNRMANDALKAPDLAKRVKDLHGFPMGGSPEDAEAFFAREAVRWKKVIEVSGAKAG